MISDIAARYTLILFPNLLSVYSGMVKINCLMKIGRKTKANNKNMYGLAISKNEAAIPTLAPALERPIIESDPVTKTTTSASKPQTYQNYDKFTYLYY